jgi:hypothetical protein
MFSISTRQSGVIRFWALTGLTARAVNAELDDANRESTVAIETMRKPRQCLKDGRENLDDNRRSGGRTSGDLVVLIQCV